jgi:hypothetical protein
VTDQSPEPTTRRERLAVIAAEYTEEIHDHRTQHQLAGVARVSRYAAVTSEGSAESSYASNGNLIVGDSTSALAEQLRQEAGEGWLAHGRAWDLDAPWHSWGNLPISFAVRVGEECTRPIQVVQVQGREDGTYLFDDLLDAEAFGEAVRHQDGHASISQEPVHDAHAADRLIDAERERRGVSDVPADHVVVGDDGEQGRHWVGPFPRAEAERQVDALVRETGLAWELLPPAAD